MINDLDSLLKNYNALQLENVQLKEEIKRLREQLGILSSIPLLSEKRIEYLISQTL
jgi:cell division septum initiation protein DivIVA